MGAGRIIKEGLGWILPARVLVRGRPSARPRVALTFDDGPHPDHTPRLLDMLDREHARATFFLQGSEAHKHPALVREIAARGHQVGNHGYSHLDARKSEPREYVADTLRAQDALQQITGTQIARIFRPPHGNVTGATFIALARQGFRFVFWSADSRDSFIRTHDALLAHVTALDVRDGDILLFHEDYAHTVEAFPAVLRLLGERPLAFETIDAI